MPPSSIKGSDLNSPKDRPPPTRRLIFGGTRVNFCRDEKSPGTVVKKHRMRVFGACAALMIASTSMASAQSPELLDFGIGKPAPPGDASMGQNMFTAICWACHSSDLSGYKGPPLTGPSFYKIWQGRRVDALADLIRNTMPKDDPGMSERAARDLVAFIVTYANRPESLKGGQAGK